MSTYEAAKWLKVSFLADEEEFSELFSQLSPFILCPLGRIIAPEERFLPPEKFLEGIKGWSESLKGEKAPSREALQKVVASALSADQESLYVQQISPERILVKIRRPVIQIQAHFFTYSQEEKTIYSGVFGKESVFWGVQCSYPQIFFDPDDQEHKKVDDAFPNTTLFRTLQRWARHATVPVSFRINGEKKTVPFRLGKNCYSWIGKHPHLAARNLEMWNG